MKLLVEESLVTKTEILAAATVLKPIVRHTPLEYDPYLSKKYRCEVYLKREDLQHVRSFKLRGAYYAIQQLAPEIRKKGVVCASAGNHAQGVAYTCRMLNVQATIFMPTTTPQQKVSQVAFFGGEQAEIRLIGDTFDASAEAAKRYAQAQEKAFVDPFNDRGIIAGQGTIAVEIVADLEKEQKTVDYVFAAIGGGGLISGISAYMKAVRPTTKIIGVEPLGAPSMKKALAANKVVTLDVMDKFVDGAAVKTVGSFNLAHVKQNVSELVLVPEGQVCSTILELYSKQAIVAEPAGALSVAALANCDIELKGKTVVCIVSGGNNDSNRMQEIEERSLIFEGLKHYFVINFPQRPGALKEFVTTILGPNDDITKFEYTKKGNKGSAPAIIGVLLKYKRDYAALLERIQQFDPHYIDLSQNQMLYTLLV